MSVRVDVAEEYTDGCIEMRLKVRADPDVMAAISWADKARSYTRTSSTIPLIGVPPEPPTRRARDESPSRSAIDRESTRLKSSHDNSTTAVFRSNFQVPATCVYETDE